MNKISRQLINVASEIDKIAENEIDPQLQSKIDAAIKNEKKYILYKKEENLWRIIACRDLNLGHKNVKKYDFGGLVESEDNLSQNGDCWIYDNAKVYGKAKVRVMASVYDNAKVYDNAIIKGNAQVYGDGTQVYGQETEIAGSAKVYDGAKVYNGAMVYDNSQIYGNGTQAYGEIIIDGKSKIYGGAKVDYDVKNQEINK